ncbi:siderophore-interacting protein [Salinibacterium sp. SYSU T00001]|uniref:siderophore-interacting protein n=1 Tax=Homoserinimonas sedimenticola TaxID=2986805 RepID=UPI0022357D47|nr:siderophore-interacting protein [Salinibacterium sedimenticola]MCW4384894.1 siderophore-interacting protein [Salinibacterium sedimenticola]
MLTLDVAVEKDARPAYRPYLVTVGALRRLSPHFVRVTFAGESLADFGVDGLDQRIKLVFPLEEGPRRGELCDVGADDPDVIAAGTWYARWRELPDELRSPFRTYTIRAARPREGEIDVDMVFHTDGGGPASRWLMGAKVGDPLIVVGPNARSIDSAVGIDWHPGDANELLLIGDETAAPAICSILESLPLGVSARAFIEVPGAADALPVAAHEGVEVTWLGRNGAEHGSLLDAAVREWVAQNEPIVTAARAARAQTITDVDVDSELLWESPERAEVGFYGWLAGESSVIKSLRRFLVTETGIDRKRIAFMGYWRRGKSELQ